MLTHYVSDDLLAHITATFRDALASDQRKQTLSVDHEMMVMSGAAERYVFSTEDGSITVDFAPQTDGCIGVDRLQMETSPSNIQKDDLGTLLETRLELYPDSKAMGWDIQDSAEAVLTISRLRDMFYLMARTNQQMRETADYLRAMAANSAKDHHQVA